MSDDELGDDWGDALNEQQAASDSSTIDESNDLAKAKFENLEDEVIGATEGAVDLDMILDIPVTISVEIGRTKINISNLLRLNQGSVVELDRIAGEPMDVLVNGTLIAHGEVVVVNEKFGIRLTDVLSTAERIRNV